MTLQNPLNERKGLKRGQRVRANRRHRRLFPKHTAREGTILNFCRETDVRVKFDALKSITQIDERWLEAV